MRILLDGQSLLPPRTGIGRVTSGILKFLQEQSSIEEICVFGCLAPIGINRKLQFHELIGEKNSPKTKYLKCPLPLGLLLYGWNQWNFPSAEALFGKYDILHGPAHVLPPRKHTPGLITIHDTSILDHPSWYPNEVQHYAKQIRKALKNADGIVVPSRYVKERLATHYDCSENRIDIVSNPFQNDFPVFSSDQKYMNRERIFGDRHPYLVWIGELNPRKNIQILPKVLSYLKKTVHKNLRLVAIGQDGYKSEMFYDEISKMGLSLSRLNDIKSDKCEDIVTTGFITEEQKKIVLSSSDCMIFPSYDEGFGYPILEAMGSGIPVVCAHTGALPEIGGHAVRTISDPNNWMEFAHELKILFTESKEYNRYLELGLERAALYQKSSLSSLLSVYTKYV